MEGELEFGVASDQDRDNSSGATTHHHFLTLERVVYRWMTGSLWRCGHRCDMLPPRGKFQRLVVCKETRQGRLLIYAPVKGHVTHAKGPSGLQCEGVSINISLIYGAVTEAQTETMTIDVN